MRTNVCARANTHRSDRPYTGFLEHISIRTWAGRHAGRLVNDLLDGGMLWAFFQEANWAPGTLAVVARRIERLDRAELEYSEEAVVVAGPTDEGQRTWTAQGMHTYGAHLAPWGGYV